MAQGTGRSTVASYPRLTCQNIDGTSGNDVMESIFKIAKNAISILTLVYLATACLHKDDAPGSSTVAIESDDELIALAEDVLRHKKPSIDTSEIQFKEISWEHCPDGKQYVVVVFIITHAITVTHSEEFVTTSYPTVSVIFHSHIGIDSQHGYVSHGHHTRKDFSDKVKLQNAVSKADANLVSSLIQEGIDLNSLDSSGRTLLHLAVSHANKDILRLLLNAGADAEVEDEDGNTPLMLASFSGTEPLVKLFIERGGHVNKGNSSGDTPLIAATMYSHFATAKYLLKQGANPNIQNNEGMTALHWAAAHGDKNIVKLLLENGADTSIENIYGNDPVEMAVEMEKEEIARMLKNSGR